MANVFHSGAFLQQCFSVHPLSLRVKRLTLPDTMGIVCVHCQSKHRLTLGSITRIIGDSEMRENGVAEELAACVDNHRDALHVTEVRMERDIIQFRCRECKTRFQAMARLWETYQP